MHLLKQVIVDQATLGGEKCKRACDLIPELTQKVTRIHAYSDGFSVSRCGIFNSNFHNKGFTTTKATPGRPNDCTNVHFNLEENVVDIIDPFKISPLAIVEHQNLCLDNPSSEGFLDSIHDSELKEAIKDSGDFDMEFSCERAPDIGKKNFKYFPMVKIGGIW